ncbi:MAG: hypothetical protein K0R82_2991 [Flavipsychrobacter sp.]|jgi:hypothetical protein|nr:hypothetical protein [Flavipsychrobacter sp.]
MEKIELKNGTGDVYVTIHYLEDLNAVMDVWTGAFGAQENFRKGLETVVEVIEKTKANKWLADLRLLKGSFDPSAEWLTTVIMPRTIELGLEFEAIVLPKEIFAKLSTKDAIQQVKNLYIRQFWDINEARQWLQSSK